MIWIGCRSLHSNPVKTASCYTLTKLSLVIGRDNVFTRDRVVHHAISVGEEAHESVVE